MMHRQHGPDLRSCLESVGVRAAIIANKNRAGRAIARLCAGIAFAFALMPAVGAAPEAGTALRAPDVRYEPTAPDVVKTMLKLAAIRPGEVVYDLGCGDGRVVIAAVREAKARGVCVDIDPQRIAESRANARRAGVEDRIRFLNQDLFETDIADADVVMLFLYPNLNLKLRPKLWGELKAGARVVSHWHDMGDWQPQQRVYLRSEGLGRNIYLWTLPRR